MSIIYLDTHEVKRTYISISRALTSDFESIYYVDLVTGCYLEFHMGKEGELEIRPPEPISLGMPGRNCLRMFVTPILRRSGRQPGKQA